MALEDLINTRLGVITKGEKCDCYNDNVVCPHREQPMHLYSHSAFLYAKNIGKPICMKCKCWDMYAGQLYWCDCKCHDVQDDWENDPWARR